MSKSNKKSALFAIAAIGIFFTSAIFLGVQFLRHGWPFVSKQAPMADMDHASMGNSSKQNGDPHQGHLSEKESNPRKLPQGYASIKISSNGPGALSYSVVSIENRNFLKKTRTVGVVALDETRTAHVHSKVRGTIDSINADFIGRQVKAGEVLCTLYSQDVYSAETEFLSILNRSSNSGAAFPSSSEGDPLLEAARKRLLLWDVPESEVRRLESSREAQRSFPLLSPRSGSIVSKTAIQGMFVEPGMELYTLADLSVVWVLADIYEADAEFVHKGDVARLTVEGREGVLTANISFLSPTIEESTRTIKARFQLDNRSATLRPGAFVKVEIDLPLGFGLAVPESAVIRTGERAIVFVVAGDELEPREVILGPLSGEYYRVQSGLKAGERVASGAEFLLDSESRIRATSSKGGGHAH
ncbi:MAG: efflux RND transporter periplasmic adaptor subunit [Spirochaetia bacterium]|nr:efflux RND transporter periplasmic adaptor subunit [Spirochaetia bacterium]